MRTKERKRKKVTPNFFSFDSFDVINGFEMAGMESWASSIWPAILKSAKISYTNDKVSTSKESNDKKSGGVALFPVSSRLLDIGQFASYRVNVGH